MEQIYSYSQQPTLIIGLGGLGSRIADDVYGRVKNDFNVSAISIDADFDTLNGFTNIPKHHIISMVQEHTPSEYLKFLPNAREWFPDNQLLLHRSFFHGAGQVRALSRLAYELSLREHRFDVLLDEVDRLAAECVVNRCSMRISIVASLVGGTASGIFIQVALLIREYLSKHFPSLNAEIQGEFILPSTFLSLNSSARVDRRNLESNAYAALKELNSINAHYFSNTVPVKLHYGYLQDDSGDDFVDALPYDYCFLYDRIISAHSLDKQYIENAMIERLFSDSANDLNDAFVNALCLDAKKRAGNLYGTICTEKLPLKSTILDSEIVRTVINRTSAVESKKAFMVRSPRKLNIDTDLFPQNTIFIEKIDTSVSDITITEFDFGIELCEMEKFKYKSGQYYMSYQCIVERLPAVITPHLDKNWQTELSDIGKEIDVEDNSDSTTPLIHKAPKVPKGSFVFISYSSREIEIANQLKHILETNGVPCWMAPQSIPAGSDYGTEIPKAIEKCKAFLLLLSDASQNSNWVPKEVGLAIGKGKIVVPFQIDNATISEAFNFYLTNSQRISAYNRMTDAYQELLNRLIDILT